MDKNPFVLEEFVFKYFENPAVYFTIIISIKALILVAMSRLIPATKISRNERKKIVEYSIDCEKNVRRLRVITMQKRAKASEYRGSLELENRLLGVLKRHYSRDIDCAFLPKEAKLEDKHLTKAYQDPIAHYILLRKLGQALFELRRLRVILTR